MSRPPSILKQSCTNSYTKRWIIPKQSGFQYTYFMNENLVFEIALLFRTKLLTLLLGKVKWNIVAFLWISSFFYFMVVFKWNNKSFFFFFFFLLFSIWTNKYLNKKKTPLTPPPRLFIYYYFSQWIIYLLLMFKNKQ